MNYRIILSVLFSIFFCSVAISQKVNSFQFYVTPINQRIGNLNKQFTIVENPNIDVDYFKVPSYEFGIDYNHKFQNNWGYSIGLSIGNSGTKTFITLKHPDFNGIALDNYYRTVDFSILGLRLGASYKMSNRLRLHAFLNLHTYFNVRSNFHWITSYGISSNQIFNYDIVIYSDGYSLAKIIPDVRADFEIFPNLNFYMGLRWKFWDIFNDYTVKVVVTGFSENENIGKNDILHLSRAKGTDLSYYFGLVYDLPFGKKNN